MEPGDDDLHKWLRLGQPIQKQEPESSQPNQEPELNQPQQEPESNQQPVEIFRSPAQKTPEEEEEEEQEQPWIHELRQQIRKEIRLLHPWILQQIKEKKEQKLHQQEQQLHDAPLEPQPNQQPVEILRSPAQEQQPQGRRLHFTRLQQRRQLQGMTASLPRPERQRSPPPEWQRSLPQDLLQRRRQEGMTASHPLRPRWGKQQNLRYDLLNGIPLLQLLPNQMPERIVLPNQQRNQRPPRMGVQEQVQNPNPNANFIRGEAIDGNANLNSLNSIFRRLQLDSSRDDPAGVRIFGQWLRPSVSQIGGASSSGSNRNPSENANIRVSDNAQINPNKRGRVSVTMNATMAGPSSASGAPMVGDDSGDETTAKRRRVSEDGDSRVGDDKQINPNKRERPTMNAMAAGDDGGEETAAKRQKVSQDETMNAAMVAGPSSSTPPNDIPSTTCQPRVSIEKQDEIHSNSDEENKPL